MKYRLKGISGDAHTITGTATRLKELAPKGKIEVFDEAGVHAWLDISHAAIDDASSWQGDRYIRPSLCVEAEAVDHEAAALAASQVFGHSALMLTPANDICQVVVHPLTAASDSDNWELIQ